MNTVAHPQIAEPQMNATPLIDVLLVLLVMLIFTLPVATHAVKLNLPHAAPGQPLPRPLVTVDIDFDGRVFWNGVVLADQAALERKLREAASALLSPRIKVVPDKRVRYENVAVVLAAAQRSQVTALEVAPIQY
jgi:biopolymer transport protein ExbD